MTTLEEKQALLSLIEQLRATSAQLSHHVDTQSLDDQIDELANEVGSIEEDDSSTGSGETTTESSAPSSAPAGAGEQEPGTDAALDAGVPTDDKGSAA